MAHPAIAANTKTRERVKNGAGPFIKESTEGDDRLWRKKVSLEKRVEERMRRSRAKSNRKRIPDSRSSMKKRSTRLNKFDGRNNKKMLIRRAK